MSVNYSLTLQSSNPSVKNAPKKYYAKVQSTGTVTVDELAAAIAYSSSLTDGDVLNVIRGLVYQMNLQLQAGKIVQMEKLGTFRLVIHSRGADDEKSFTTEHIRSVSIGFRAGDSTRAATSTRAGAGGGLTFKRVESHAEKNGGGSSSGGGSKPSNPGGGNGGSGNE
jgi:predicted histone-like DNA-binding protein